VSTDLPSWAGSIDAAALSALLGLGGERDWIDYKRQCDLSTVRGEVELAKDAGAMMMLGGYVLVGADDLGRPTGDVEHLELFDPAVLPVRRRRPGTRVVISGATQYQPDVG
jgi:hypothetical protein